MSRKFEFSPTIGAFYKNQKRMQFLFGPIGGGKTTGVLMKIIALAHLQQPNANGVRKTRWAVVRNTRPQLRDSVIKTVFEWLPPNGKTIKWNETNLDMLLDIPLPDGTRVSFSEVIQRGADMLGWSLDELLTRTLDAMRVVEPLVAEQEAKAAPAKKK